MLMERERGKYGYSHERIERLEERERGEEWRD